MIASTRHPMEKALAVAVALFGTALIGSCAAPQSAPPAPAPRPVASPAPTPAPVPTFTGDWRDAPQTPGDWTWSMMAGRSTAQFGRPGFTPVARISCDRANARVIVLASGNATGAVPMTLRTTFTMRPLSSDPAISGAGGVGFALPASDPILDAIAFSRGRFAVEVAGLEPLYLPAWPELSRVIEDCR